MLTSHLQPEGTQNLSEIQLAYTLRYRNDMNDIYSCSWTPMDLLDTNIGYMSSFVKDALKSSVEKVSKYFDFLLEPEVLAIEHVL